jgi:hypothetical protein
MSIDGASIENEEKVNLRASSRIVNLSGSLARWPILSSNPAAKATPSC